LVWGGNGFPENLNKISKFKSGGMERIAKKERGERERKNERKLKLRPRP